MTREATTQCKSCPWRVDCEPLEDIPNGYSVELHEALRGTIAEPGAVCLAGGQRIMACHYSKPGEEFACAGWMHHQLGDGNNIWLRIEVMRGRMPLPLVDGEQHRTFDDTLPADERKRQQTLATPRRRTRGSAITRPHLSQRA